MRDDSDRCRNPRWSRACRARASQPGRRPLRRATTRRERAGRSRAVGSGHGARLRWPGLESRREEGDPQGRNRAPARSPGGRGQGRVDLPRHRARRLPRPAPVPERGRGARDRHVGPRAPGRPARAGAGLRPRPGHGPAARPADTRPRPPALRRRDDRRAAPQGPAPAPARAPLRLGTARRAGSRPRGAGSGLGPGAACKARLVSMSNLDELDEFEAELELQLKKEYTAVFGLFRYCVLTQDATYLCNKLDLAQISQPNYPFFHLKMEDVWVWDKNRPTRIIPRAEVWTSSDVTVEELRTDGDEPSLTAEALAEKIGESLSTDDDL